MKRERWLIIKNGEILEVRYLTFSEAVEASQIANECNIDEVLFIREVRS